MLNFSRKTKVKVCNLNNVGFLCTVVTIVTLCRVSWLVMFHRNVGGLELVAQALQI